MKIYQEMPIYILIYSNDAKKKKKKKKIMKIISNKILINYTYI